MQRLIERAYADKLKKAEERLKQLEASSPKAFGGVSEQIFSLTFAGFSVP